MQAHGREGQEGDRDGEEHKDEVDAHIERWELGEALLERQCEKERGENLRAGLEDTELLEQFVPVAVRSLCSVSSRPSLESTSAVSLMLRSSSLFTFRRSEDFDGRSRALRERMGRSSRGRCRDPRSQR